MLVILGLIIGAGYFMLKGEIKTPFFKEDETLELRRLSGFPTNVPHGKEIEKQRQIIKTQSELDQFLALVDDSGLTRLQEEINFDKEMLIAATTDLQTIEGTHIKVKKVYSDKENDRLLVSVLETEPGPSCPQEKWNNIGVEIVAISKTAKEVEFERVKEIDTCE